MSQIAARIQCASCGKSYPSKPQYAGRLVQCKCGNKIQVPAITPAAEFENAFAGGCEVTEELQLKPVSRAAVAAVMRPRMIPVVPNAVPVSRPHPVETEWDLSTQLKDLYVPAIMIVAGVILLFMNPTERDGRGSASSLPLVLLEAVINIVLVFGSMFLAVRILDLGLGMLRPAILKLFAVAILPGAVSIYIGHVTGGIMNWGICLILYYALMSYLFEMEPSEIRVATGIIYIARILTTLLVMILFMPHPAAYPARTVGPANANSNRAIAASGSGASTTDQNAINTIAAGRVVEALEWCSSDQTTHMGTKVSKTVMRILSRRFYAAGAKKVWAANARSMNGLEICSELIVQMPTDSAARQRVIFVYDSFKHLPNPTPDGGDHFLDISLEE